MVKGPSGTNWEFEGFRVMPEKRLLIAGGAPVPLTSKAFDTLVVLIENRDRVVTKDELLSSVWPGVEVEEGNLTQQIFLLRKALGETAQQPRYIVTIPGHGYRFTARVEAISDDSAATEVSTSSATPPPAAPRRRVTLIATGLVAFGIIALLAIALGPRWTPLEKAGVPPDFSKHIAKITESGRATNSAISRDGRLVAYIENDGDHYSLWTKPVGAEGKTTVVPREPFVLAHLSFSPDGEYIYFARFVRGGFVLSRVPTIGGRESLILNDVDSAVSFSPDGREFAFQRGAGTENHIVIAAALGGSQRILATRKAPLSFSVSAPDWSPDGKVVATSVLDATHFSQTIVLLAVDDGGSRELYTSHNALGRLRWLPDGSGLLTVISELVEARFSGPLPGGAIWRIRYPDGRAERLTSDLADHDLCCLDIGANGSTVVSVTNSLVSDLFIAPTGQLDALRQLTWGHPVITRHSWLPDSDTIVYRDLSGRLSAVHQDGREFNLPLPDGHKAVGDVSVCGDGRYVVFQAVPGNSIWRVTPNAGGADKLTSGTLDWNPACSPDGKWVLYSSARSGSPELWRVPIDGGGPAPLVQDESWDALPSPSGRLIYYTGVAYEERPIPARQSRWIVISSSDRKVQFNLATPDGADLRPNWAPDESGLDYVVTRNGVSNIWRLPLSGGLPVQITRFSVGRIFTFAWSPDGQWLSLGIGASRSDVVLMSRKQ